MGQKHNVALCYVFTLTQAKLITKPVPVHVVILEDLIDSKLTLLKTFFILSKYLKHLRIICFL